MRDRELYSIEEARELLGGIARNTIYELMRNGDLASVQVGRRRFISAIAIAAFIATSTTTEPWFGFLLNDWRAYSCALQQIGITSFQQTCSVRILRYPSRTRQRHGDNLGALYSALASQLGRVARV